MWMFRWHFSIATTYGAAFSKSSIENCNFIFLFSIRIIKAMQQCAICETICRNRRHYSKCVEKHEKWFSGEGNDCAFVNWPLIWNIKRRAINFCTLNAVRRAITFHGNGDTHIFSLTKPQGSTGVNDILWPLNSWDERLPHPFPEIKTIFFEFLFLFRKILIEKTSNLFVA